MRGRGRVAAGGRRVSGGGGGQQAAAGSGGEQRVAAGSGGDRAGTEQRVACEERRRSDEGGVRGAGGEGRETGRSGEGGNGERRRRRRCAEEGRRGGAGGEGGRRGGVGRRKGWWAGKVEGAVRRTMSRSRPERSLHMRFQRLSPSHFSGWTQRWRTSTSLISQMVSTCCTASALSPGFQHERSRLFRKSAAISSSAITAFALLSAPRLAPIRPASSRGSRRGETDRLCGIGGPPRNAGCTRGFGAGAEPALRAETRERGVSWRLCDQDAQSKGSGWPRGKRREEGGGKKGVGEQRGAEREEAS